MNGSEEHSRNYNCDPELEIEGIHASQGDTAKGENGYQWKVGVTVWIWDECVSSNASCDRSLVLCRVI